MSAGDILEVLKKWVEESEGQTGTILDEKLNHAETEIAELFGVTNPPGEVNPTLGSADTSVDVSTISECETNSVTAAGHAITLNSMNPWPEAGIASDLKTIRDHIIPAWCNLAGI